MFVNVQALNCRSDTEDSKSGQQSGCHMYIIHCRLAEAQPCVAALVAAVLNEEVTDMLRRS